MYGALAASWWGPPARFFVGSVKATERRPQEWLRGTLWEQYLPRKENRPVASIGTMRPAES